MDRPLPPLDYPCKLRCLKPISTSKNTTEIKPWNYFFGEAFSKSKFSKSKSKTRASPRGLAPLLLIWICSILKRHSGQVFHSWLKCWKKSETHSHLIWSFYVLSFQDSAVQSQQFSSYFSAAILPVLWPRLTFGKLAWIYVKSSLFTILNLYFVLTAKRVKTLIESYKHAVSFRNFVCSWQPWQNFRWKKAILRWNQNCSILETEGRRKLKFGEISFQIYRKFLRKSSKKYSTWMPLKTLKLKQKFHKFMQFLKYHSMIINSQFTIHATLLIKCDKPKIILLVVQNIHTQHKISFTKNYFVISLEVTVMS